MEQDGKEIGFCLSASCPRRDDYVAARCQPADGLFLVSEQRSFADRSASESVVKRASQHIGQDLSHRLDSSVDRSRLEVGPPNELPLLEGRLERRPKVLVAEVEGGFQVALVALDDLTTCLYGIESLRRVAHPLPPSQGCRA